MSLAKHRAWFIGAGIITVAYMAWLIILQAKQYSDVLIFLLWISPFVAALVSAYLAPQRKVLFGMSMVLPTVFLTVVFNVVYQWIGIAVDFPGVRGGLILFAITLIYSCFLCGVGSILGLLLAKKFQKKRSLGSQRTGSE
jgi:hypothetical protein